MMRALARSHQRTRPGKTKSAAFFRAARESILSVPRSLSTRQSPAKLAHPRARDLQRFLRCLDDGTCGLLLPTLARESRYIVASFSLGTTSRAAVLIPSVRWFNVHVRARSFVPGDA